MTRRACLLSGFIAAGTLFGRPVRGARYKVSRGAKPSTARSAASEDARSGPLVFDLMADERWPIRGLDPVLVVGGVSVESYQYGNSENTLLRFTCYEGNKLEDGARVFVQYGDDVNSRTSLPDFRWADVASQ